jgi:hypothetical protein
VAPGTVESDDALSGKRASFLDHGRGGNVAALLIGLGVVAFQLPIFDRWFSSMDEGHVLLFSDLIAKGGHLYRDATLYPLPGAFYLLAQFFKLFGSSILLSRWIVVFEFAAFVVMLWVLVRAMVSRGTALTIVASLLVYRIWAFPHWHVYSYSTTSLLLIVAAVLCQLHFFAVRRLRWLAVAGVLFGLSVYCKQDYGAAAMLVMSFALVVEARAQPAGAPAPLAAPLGVFIGAGAAVGATVGAYFLYHGILGDLMQQVVHHISGIGAFEYTTYPPLWPFFVQEPKVRDAAGLFAFFPGIVSTVDLETLRQNWFFRETFVYDAALKIFYWGPYAFGAFAVVRLHRTRDALLDVAARGAWLRELMLCGLAVTFLLLLTLNRPQDFLHLAVLYWPFLCLLGVYHSQRRRGRHRAVAWILGLALLVPTAAVLGYSGRAYARLLAQNSTWIEGERSGIRAKPAEAKLMREVTAFIHEHTTPGETVAVLPYFPIVHFLADRVGPDRSAYIVWPFAEFEDRDQRIIDSIERHGTDTVVYNFTQFLTFPAMREFAPDLYAHLVDNFEMTRVFSYDNAGFMLAGLRRRSGPEPGLSLLDEHWAETAVWIESDEGPPRALPPRTRTEFAAREPWPFRRALAIRPSSGGERTIFQLPLQVRPGDRLRTAIGVHPERWFVMPAYSTYFELTVQSDDVTDVLHAQSLDPHLVLEDRAWSEIEVPLDAYAGKQVRLMFSVSVDSPAGESRLMGGWAEPRLVRLEAAGKGVAD